MKELFEGGEDCEASFLWIVCVQPAGGISRFGIMYVLSGAVLWRMGLGRPCVSGDVHSFVQSGRGM